VTRRLPGRGLALALAAVLAAGVLLAHFQVEDVDVFWHLKAGAVTLERGRVLGTNLFSWTYPDRPWVNSEWLFQVALAGAYGAAGWGGVAALKLLLVGAVATALLLALTTASGGPASAAALTVAALCAMRPRLTERPHLASFLVFALILLVLARRRRGSRASVLALPALFALWGNLNAEMVVGLLFLAAVLAGEIVDRRREGLPPFAVGDRFPLAVLLCFPALLANPFTWRTPVFPLLHVNLGAAIDVLEFRSSFGSPVPLFWAALALTGALLLRDRRAVGFRGALPVLATAVLAACYLRAIPYFLLAAAPLLHERLMARAPARGAPGARALTFAPVAGAVALLGGSLFADHGQLFRWGSGVNERQFPVAAAGFLGREALPARLFNDYNEGGYLLFRLWPRVPVFQDSRCLQAYPREFIAEANGAGPREGWQRFLAGRGVSTALVRRHQLAGRGFDRSAWGMVYWDDFWAILVRRGPEGDAVLERLEYRHYLPGTAVARAGEPELTALAAEARRNQAARLFPSADVAGDLGLTLAALGRLPEAVAAFEEAVRIAPRFGPGWVNLGQVSLAAGDRRRAESAFRAALALDSSLEQARAGLRALGAAAP
jgi:hypothetical protein